MKIDTQTRVRRYLTDMGMPPHHLESFMRYLGHGDRLAEYASLRALTEYETQDEIDERGRRV